MITLAQASQWAMKYSNVKIIDQKGEQFRVDLRHRRQDQLLKAR